MARPTIYSQEIADEICERLIEGESLRRICHRAGMPRSSTVCRWLADGEHLVFREQYAQARVAQSATLADEAVYIADTPKMGVVTMTKAVTVGDVTGEEVKTKRADMLGHRTLQVQTRKWFAAKLDPKKWGERLEIDAEVTTKRVSSKPLTEEAWEARHAPPADDP